MVSCTTSSDVAFVFDTGFGCGGAERVAVQLLRHWIASGRTVFLITMRGPEADFFSVPAGVQRIVIGGVADSRNMFSALINNVQRLIRLRRALRDSGARTVLAFQTRTNVRTAFASLGLGKRLVLSERSDPGQQRFNWPWHVLRRLSYGVADVVTANSRNGIEQLGRFVPDRRLVFVPNPLDLPPSSARVAGSTTILNVGSLKWHKGHALLIEALAILGQGGEPWSLTFVGDGPERRNLEALARSKNLVDRVNWVGLVSDPAPHYQAAGIFAFPSQFEGMPNALLEAMSHGLPCVVSDSLPGVLEYVRDGEASLLFRSGDANDLACKLAMLIEDGELRAKLGRAARDCMTVLAAERRYTSWDNVLWPAGKRTGQDHL